jgi:hypothetical protein
LTREPPEIAAVAARVATVALESNGEADTPASALKARAPTFVVHPTEHRDVFPDVTVLPAVTEVPKALPVYP